MEPPPVLLNRFEQYILSRAQDPEVSRQDLSSVEELIRSLQEARVPDHKKEAALQKLEALRAKLIEKGKGYGQLR